MEFLMKTTKISILVLSLIFLAQIDASLARLRPIAAVLPKLLPAVSVMTLRTITMRWAFSRKLSDNKDLVSLARETRELTLKELQEQNKELLGQNKILLEQNKRSKLMAQNEALEKEFGNLTLSEFEYSVYQWSNRSQEDRFDGFTSWIRLYGYVKSFLIFLENNEGQLKNHTISIHNTDCFNWADYKNDTDSYDFKSKDYEEFTKITSQIIDSVCKKYKELER